MSRCGGIQICFNPPMLEGFVGCPTASYLDLSLGFKTSLNNLYLSVFLIIQG